MPKAVGMEQITQAKNVGHKVVDSDLTRGCQTDGLNHATQLL